MRYLLHLILLYHMAHPPSNPLVLQTSHFSPSPSHGIDANLFVVVLDEARQDGECRQNLLHQRPRLASHAVAERPCGVAHELAHPAVTAVETVRQHLAQLRHNAVGKHVVAERHAVTANVAQAPHLVAVV